MLRIGKNLETTIKDVFVNSVCFSFNVFNFLSFTTYKTEFYLCSSWKPVSVWEDTHKLKALISSKHVLQLLTGQHLSHAHIVSDSFSSYQTSWLHNYLLARHKEFMFLCWGQVKNSAAGCLLVSLAFKTLSNSEQEDWIWNKKADILTKGLSFDEFGKNAKAFMWMVNIWS